MGSYLFGSDIGTSSCKSVLIDFNGNIVSQSSKEYWPKSPKPGYAEIEPEEWFIAFVDTLKECCNLASVNPKDIECIGLTGQMVSLVCLDADGRSIRPSILWYDVRGSKEVDYIRSLFGDKITDITSNPLNSTFTLLKLLWVKFNEPDTFKKIYKILWSPDYILMKLTKNFVTDPTSASSSLIYNMVKNEWSEEILCKLEIPLSILPQVMNAGNIGGKITREVSTLTGLKEGLPVAVGTGDVGADNLAAGIDKPSCGMIRFGTCATISISTSVPVSDKKGKCPCSAHSIPGIYLVQGTSAAFGSSVRWLRDCFYKVIPEGDLAGHELKDLYKIMDKEAQEVDAGSGGLFFHSFSKAAPYWNPNIRGEFFGISEYHRRGHFARSVFEGTSYELKEALENLLGIEGVNKPKEFFCVGRGTLSNTWCKVLSNVLGVDLILASESDAALGAAMLAGICVSRFSNFRDAISKCVKYSGKVSVDLELHLFYNKKYGEFKSIHDSLVNLCDFLYKSNG